MTDQATATHKKVPSREVKHFVWADEPPSIYPKKANQKNTIYAGIVAKLKRNKKNRGRWALVRRDVNFTVVTYLNRVFPEIEWTARRNGNGRHDLWASWRLPLDQQVDTKAVDQSVQQTATQTTQTAINHSQFH